VFQRFRTRHVSITAPWGNIIPKPTRSTGAPPEPAAILGRLTGRKPESGGEGKGGPTNVRHGGGSGSKKETKQLKKKGHTR
jgi:hypothetical protein